MSNAKSPLANVDQCELFLIFLSSRELFISKQDLEYLGTLSSRSSESDNKLTYVLAGPDLLPAAPSPAQAPCNTPRQRLHRLNERASTSLARRYKNQQRQCRPANQPPGSSPSHRASSAHPSQQHKPAQSAQSSSQSPNPAASMPRPPCPSSAPRTPPPSSAKNTFSPCAPAPSPSKRA